MLVGHHSNTSKGAGKSSIPNRIKMVLSVLRDGLRAAVSGDRRRLKEGGHNLDLSYVTPSIIGMGFPGSGVEGLYRNHISDVASFFSERHSENVLVLNLSQRRYDYSEFGGRVLEFGFPDHHSPPLPLLLKACQEMHSWLHADEKNVVAVHCMAGKGRTGTVIASYLLFCGQCRTADEAFALFQETRTQTGVSMPSQRRYVHYMEQILPSWRQLGHLDTAPRVVLRRITVHTVPCFEASQRRGSTNGSCRPAIQVLTAAGGEEASQVLFSSMHEQDTDALREYSAPDDDRMDFEVMRPLQGDILVRCFHMQNSSANGLMSLKLLQGGGDTLAFRFAFHTTFLPSEGVMHLRRDEVDDWEESGGHFSDDFRVELVYEHLPPSASAAAAGVDGSPSVPPSSSSSLADPKAAPDAINGSREVQQQQHQGWLSKKGGYGSSELQRRWFVLRQKQQLLTYWKDPEDTRPKGSMPLAEITSVQALPGDDNDGSSVTYKFSVVTPGRTYLLVADSEAERTAWLELLHQKATAGSGSSSSSSSSSRPTEA